MNKTRFLTRSFSYMGMVFYTYNNFKGEHFSMNIGGALLVMDLGLRLDNGSPWIFWPVPFFTFSWEYEWFTLNLISDAKLVIAPNKPFSVLLSVDFNDYNTLGKSIRNMFVSENQNKIGSGFYASIAFRISPF